MPSRSDDTPLRNTRLIPRPFVDPRRFYFVALTLFSLFFLSSSHAQQTKRAPDASSLTKRIATILERQGAREAHWGIHVVGIDSGKEIYGWNQRKLFTPASTVKLFTTAAALVRLGPDFIYRTTAEASTPIDEKGRLRSDLVLVGRGDPNLSARVLPYSGRTERVGSPTRVFEELAEQLWTRGLRTVDGDLIVDDTYFVHQPYGRAWTASDIVWGYATPVAALSINDNVMVLTVAPGIRPGDPAAVWLEPMGDFYQVTNRIVTIAKSRGTGANAAALERRVLVERLPGSRSLLLSGEIAEGDPGWTQAISIDDPAAFAGEFFRRELTRRGVEIKGKVSVRRKERFEIQSASEESAPNRITVKQAVGANPPLASEHTTASDHSAIESPANVLALHQSAPLAESIKIINKVSQNLHAEMLLRTLGSELQHRGSFEGGLQAVNEFLGEIGVPESEAALDDASGLSRQNLATPSAMTTLLRSMYRSTHRVPWLDSLPIGGVDGSLTLRFKGVGMSGRVRAKTGTINGEAALAGYITRPGKEPLAFAIFVNHHNLNRAAAARLVDLVVREIAR